LPAGDIFRIAPRCWDAPALVTNALELLNQKRAQSAFSERLAHFHVNVAAMAGDGSSEFAVARYDKDGLHFSTRILR
jgi:hypothetical protein